MSLIAEFLESENPVFKAFHRQAFYDNWCRQQKPPVAVANADGGVVIANGFRDKFVVISEHEDGTYTVDTYHDVVHLIDAAYHAPASTIQHPDISKALIEACEQIGCPLDLDLTKTYADNKNMHR